LVERIGELTAVNFLLSDVEAHSRRASLTFS
jgi:hypothetical protein